MMEETCENCFWRNCEYFCENDEGPHYAEIVSGDDTCKYWEMSISSIYEEV